MKLFKISLLIVIISFPFFSIANCSIIPQPLSFKLIEGEAFVFTSTTKWVIPTNAESDTKKMIAPLIDAFKKAAGFEYKTTTKTAAKNAVIFTYNNSLKNEEYILEIDNEQIRIDAATNKGFFYALQSIRLLLPASIESKSIIRNYSKWSLPALKIKDAPTMEYRGFMLDVSRYFMPKESLLKIIDLLGMLKINTLHLHLVDDNGWRLEIKRYPKLTEIGAWRVKRDKEYPARLGPTPEEATSIGGFYTQEDMKEIIHYAQARAIKIIPEIEMPAHTVSSLAAYPHLACDSEGKFIGVLPGFIGHNGYTPVYCAGKDEVFTFLENVLTEVIELFPSDYIHVGGDEATLAYWKECDDCKSRMDKEKITEVGDLQGYFLNRINTFLQSKGKIMMGWDELVESKIPKDAVIMGWRGDGHAAFKAGKLGHKYIMAPAKTLYFIRYQGPQWFEPLTYFGNNTLLDVYNYNPINSSVDKKTMDLMMGAQACLWTEFVKNPNDAEYLMFPRLLSFAENTWSKKENQNWANFLNRLDDVLLHFNVLDVNYAHSMYNIDHKCTPVSNEIKVELNSIRPDVQIRYTLENREPNNTDTIYNQPLYFKNSTTIKAATFSGKEQLGKVLVLPLNFNATTAKEIKGDNESNLHLLVNGLRGSSKYSDFEWCGWYDKDASFNIDLGTIQPIKTIKIGGIVDENMRIAYPSKITIHHSSDGKTYIQAGEITLTKEQSFAFKTSTKDFIFNNLNTTARYIKVDIKNPGLCPKGNAREGQNSWMYFDEVVVE